MTGVSKVSIETALRRFRAYFTAVAIFGLVSIAMGFVFIFLGHESPRSSRGLLTVVMCFGLGAFLFIAGAMLRAHMQARLRRLASAGSDPRS